MAKAKFNLKDYSATNQTLIYLVFHYDGKRLKLSTGSSIDPKHWNRKTQRARELMELPELNDINDQLELWSQKIREAYRTYHSTGISPNTKELGEEFLKAVKQPNRSVNDFWHHFHQFIEYQSTRISERTLIDYNRALRKHLMAIESAHDLKLSISGFQNRSGGLADRFTNYLSTEAINSRGETGLDRNTIGKQHKNLKAFLNWCFDRNVLDRFSLKHLPTITEEVESVYLDEKELDQLEALKLTGMEKQFRDTFLLGCETGLRYSDFTTIKPEHVSNDNLDKYQQKTKKKVRIPLSTRAKNILDEYDYRIPAPQSITEFNKVLREVCKKAGIDQPKAALKGNMKDEQFTPKYTLVTSHTARRSFCTNKFHKGMPAQAIMTISGHKTERAFMRYLKLDSEIVAERFRDYF